MKKLVTKVLATCCLLAIAGMAYANSTPQTLPFSQDWTNIGLITVNNDWSAVPGIVGYRGDDITASTGVDPQTLLIDGTVVVNVTAQHVTTNISGGLGEFELANPVVGFQGSGTADAPNLVIYIDASCAANMTVSYNLRDIDGTTDNAQQQVALQYRLGGTGNWTNVPAGYVSDASTGPSLATLVTPVSALLPAVCNGAANLQLRVITSNAVGNDEWVGVDDISVTGTNTCGACCLRNTTSGACQILSGAACQALGGIYLGDGTFCGQPGIPTCATPTKPSTWGKVKSIYR